MASKDNLYFIRILQNAFESEDREQVLISAFTEIKEKGDLPEYKEGYRNFEKFIKVCDEYASSQPEIVENVKADIMELKLNDIASGIFKGSDAEKQKVLKLIKDNPDLYSKYSKLYNYLAAFSSEDHVFQIEIEKDGHSIGVFEFNKESNRILIKEISKGAYSIKLSTGRLLWEGKLREEDLIWTKAFPKEGLPAAAETEPIHQRPTLTESLLEGEIVMEVYPWLKSGIILLSLGKTK